jgi:hypothetical protein
MVSSNVTLPFITGITLSPLPLICACAENIVNRINMSAEIFFMYAINNLGNNIAVDAQLSSRTYVRDLFFYDIFEIPRRYARRNDRFAI